MFNEITKCIKNETMVHRENVEWFLCRAVSYRFVKYIIVSILAQKHITQHNNKQWDLVDKECDIILSYLNSLNFANLFQINAQIRRIGIYFFINILYVQ